MFHGQREHGRVMHARDCTRRARSLTVSTSDAFEEAKERMHIWCISHAYPMRISCVSHGEHIRDAFEEGDGADDDEEDGEGARAGS